MPTCTRFHANSVHATKKDKVQKNKMTLVPKCKYLNIEYTIPLRLFAQLTTGAADT